LQVEVEMANIPSSKLNGEEKKKEREEREDEESFSRAAQLVSSLVLPMALQSATELGVFEVLKEAGENAKLSAKDIASKISCTNPEATSMLDRILTLLSSHSILLSSLASDNLVPPTFHRLYTITPVAKFFARNSDGVSLGPLMALLQDKIFLHSWLNSFSFSLSSIYHFISFSITNNLHKGSPFSLYDLDRKEKEILLFKLCFPNYFTFFDSINNEDGKLVAQRSVLFC